MGRPKRWKKQNSLEKTSGWFGLYLKTTKYQCYRLKIPPALSLFLFRYIYFFSSLIIFIFCEIFSCHFFSFFLFFFVFFLMKLLERFFCFLSRDCSVSVVGLKF